MSRAAKVVVQVMRTGGAVWRPRGSKLWFLCPADGTVRKIRNRTVVRLIERGLFKIDYRVSNPCSSDEYLVKTARCA